MNVLSVTRDVEGGGGLVQLPLHLITHMVYLKAKNRVVVHTVDEEYYIMGTLMYWKKAISATGYRFVCADKTNVVNIDRIKAMDSDRHIAYFEEFPTKHSKSCTLTSIRFNEISKRIGIIGSSICFA
ncbi:LytTR family transcriptional regulator DNA-binding domain-containing protein [Paenibacillus rhizophilus]|nr:LytTR family transcriptional regulator DNA-binding domain-containing protein [Paenibacillus rhizophilus]